MKFFDAPKFMGTIDDVPRYLKEKLGAGLRDLYAGLRSLSFADNFRSFTWTGDISAGSTVTITNGLTAIPSSRIVVRAIPLAAGTVIIDDSLTPWSPDFVYLKNAGSAAVRVTVIFFE